MSQTSRRSLLSASIPAALTMGFGSALFAQDAASASPLANYFSSAFDREKHAYALPKLPYAYEALEPNIDAQTMTLHHTKHHQAYVDNANKALKLLREIKGADAEPRTVEGLQRDLSFNVGGHMLHTLFWAIMGPNAGGEPTGRAGELIKASFGDYANFKAYFTKVAMSVKGSGWALLVHDPLSDSLLTFALGDQDTRFAAGTVPILGVDVWEHAYYLKYQNKRADYVNAWFNTINWDAVNGVLGVHGQK
ncbi:MAG: superoxide dismutase [Tepidisphaeraceae bacterium]